MRNSQPVTWPGTARWTREELIDVLRRRLTGSVSQAYLFGSYARGTATDASDIDLIVIRETDVAWIKRADALVDMLFDLGPMDLLVYTPEEWSMRKNGARFIDDVAAELVRVI